MGQGRPELTSEVYQTWLEVEQRGLKKTPEYRNVMLRVDRHALWLAGLVRLSSPDAALPFSSLEKERIATLSIPPLLLRFEALDECSQMRGDGTRDGVVLVPQAFPNR